MKDLRTNLSSRPGMTAFRFQSQVCAPAAERPRSALKGDKMIRLITTIISLLLMATYSLAAQYSMPNISMLPTIQMKASVEVDASFYKSHKIQRFEIVVVEDPDGKGKKYVKRIVGLGGELISIKNGKVYINKTELSEPFESIKATEDFPPFKIPDDEYFLLGDNRSASWDSRYWQKKTVGPALIHGKVINSK